MTKVEELRARLDRVVCASMVSISVTDFHETLDFLIAAAREQMANELGVSFLPITQGLIALVDTPDMPLTQGHSWYALRQDRGNKQSYVATWIHGKNVRLSRLLLGAPDDMVVDHINHNPLDNRRCNIRICTLSENAMGQSKRKDVTASRYKGVTFKKETGRWDAQIRVEGKKLHLGYFATEEAAARAYDEAAKKYFGEYALLNPLLAPAPKEPNYYAVGDGGDGGESHS